MKAGKTPSISNSGKKFSTASTIDILPSRSGNLGIISLNRPSALNALSLDMIRSLNNILPQFQADESIKATLFEGCMTKKNKPCFCSGGDVKAVYMARKQELQEEIDGDFQADFFREEYTMNNLIATQSQSCPQISIWDGIVMGGGVGISVHGRYRVATENTLFAMPETAIGLFPDVGSMYWLPRLEGGIGRYLALTGARLKADDLIYSGLATHYVPASSLPELRDSLIQATNIDNVEEIVFSKMLDSFSNSDNGSNSFLARNREKIDQHFLFDSVEEIFASLDQGSDEFDAKTLHLLKKMSPTSLKVTLEAIKRGAQMPDVASSLMMEYRLSQAFMREGSDFYEGIRALLVDKDKSPKWNPKNIESVSEEYVQSFFESLGQNDDLIFESKQSKL